MIVEVDNTMFFRIITSKHASSPDDVLKEIDKAVKQKSIHDKLALYYVLLDGTINNNKELFSLLDNSESLNELILSLYKEYITSSRVKWTSALYWLFDVKMATASRFILNTRLGEIPYDKTVCDKITTTRPELHVSSRHEFRALIHDKMDGIDDKIVPAIVKQGITNIDTFFNDMDAKSLLSLYGRVVKLYNESKKIDIDDTTTIPFGNKSTTITDVTETEQ